MFGPPSRKKIFVVQCKRCQRDVPSGADAFPFQSITVNCPLCGEQRRYRPSDVFLGPPHVLINAQQKEQRGLLWK